MTTVFEKAFGPDALQAFAGERSFGRGAGYAADGRVKRLKVGDAEAAADVRGTQTYRVRLWLEDGEPMFSCTCPVAADGRFCKHCVAVGLMAADPLAAATLGSRKKAAEELRAYLEGLDNSRLVDLLMTQADEDELLRGRLEVEAARARGVGIDLKDYRRAIRQVMKPRGFIDYRSVYDYARGVDDLVDSLADLLASGFAAQVIELCEYALTCLEDALGNVDDSDGQMSDIRDRLTDLHHDACLAARPDPAALAERLFDWELHSDWGTFFDAAATYADVLGETGLATYRRRADEVWARTPPVAPGDERGYSTGRFAITHIMETLAELTGDVDALVAIKAHDLSSPYCFVEIAEIYRQAGRHDDALAWAERGMAAYPDCTDDRLLEILADEYERRGRGEEAVLLMWSLLERRPILDSYQLLKAHAVKGGDWGPWRAKALDCLRPAASGPPTPPGPGRVPKPVGRPALNGGLGKAGMQILMGAPIVPTFRWSADCSEVFRALLWEDDADAAWEEAVAGGCSIRLWMELAAARAVGHPEDALPVYVQHVERLIDQKNRRGYEEAVETLHTIGELMDRLGRGDDFPEYLATVRAKHKQKRSLMKLLDEAEWRRGTGGVATSAAEAAQKVRTHDAT